VSTKIANENDAISTSLSDLSSFPVLVKPRQKLEVRLDAKQVAEVETQSDKSLGNHIDTNNPDQNKVENQNNGQEQKGQTYKTTDRKHNAHTNTDMVITYIAGTKRQSESQSKHSTSKANKQAKAEGEMNEAVCLVVRLETYHASQIGAR
jgi:hypothetical protein